jgi:hypothetical protein
MLGEQVGAQRPDLDGQFACERAFGPRELADATQLVTRHPDPSGLRHGGQAPGDPVKPAGTVKLAGRHRRLKLRIELNQMPAQPVLMAGALGYQIGTMIMKQPDLQRPLIKTRGRQ